MYGRFIRNTAISAAAYFAISVLGLWAVGVLADGYGLAAYGVVALTRLFLPNGLANVFELGASDNASHAIATALVTRDWPFAFATLRALTGIVFAAACASALALGLVSAHIGAWLDVPAHEQAVFANAMLATAAILPFALPALLAEGVIRGFENYGQARAVEVLSSGAFALGCFVLAHRRAPYIDVIHLSIGLAVVRGVLSCFLAARSIRPLAKLHGGGQARAGWAEALSRTRVVAPNRVLGTLQTQSPALVVGFVVGPVGAAAFDILMRLPRFAKSALGLVNSAVLPLASRLEAGNRDDELRRFEERGLLWITLVCAPPLFAAATFSRPLLQLWIGPELAQQWGWQSFAFVTPLLTVMIGFGATSLFARTRFVAAMNAFILLRIFLQFAVAFAFVRVLSERAFILGTVLSVMITAVWEFRLIFREHALDRTVRNQILKIMGLGLLLSCVCLPLLEHVRTMALLLAGMGLFAGLHLLTGLLFVVPAPVATVLRLYRLARGKGDTA